MGQAWLSTEPRPHRRTEILQYIAFLNNFSCVPLSYHTHIFNINGKRHFLTFQCCYLLLNLLHQKWTLTRYLYIHFHSIRLCACQKRLFKIKILCKQRQSSIKGRHSVGAEMNAESSDYGYCPYVKIVFVVQFSKVGCQDISVPYWAERQANASPIASLTLQVGGWTLGG